jgi:hypothetical protein
VARAKWVAQLVGENFLAVYDVVVDIHKERQLVGDKVNIPYFQDVVKFPALLPGDTDSLRDRYGERRWKAVNLLETHSAVKGVHLDQGDHRWDSVIVATVKEPAFSEVVSAVEHEMNRLSQQTGADDSSTAVQNATILAAGLQPLLLPETVSVRWLASHVPISFWFWLVGTYIIVFGVGVKFGDNAVLRRLMGESPEEKSSAPLPAKATFLPGDLDIPTASVISVGGANAAPDREIFLPVRAEVIVSAENGPITLTRKAAIIRQQFNPDRIVTNDIQPNARVISVAPDRPIVRPDNDTGKVTIEFDRSSIIPLGGPAAEMQHGEKVPAGMIVVRINYMVNMRSYSTDVEIPVYLRR